MFITPMPPSASVTMPTMVKKSFIRSIIRPNISVWSEVSHIADGFAIGRIEAMMAREHSADVLLERPVDVVDPARATVEHAGQLRRRPTASAPR